jgi:hypothetical protein
MAKQKLTGLSSSLLTTDIDSPPSGDNSSTTNKQRQVSLTVKVPPEMYVELKSFGARRRISNQQIALEAIKEYLKAHDTNRAA